MGAELKKRNSFIVYVTNDEKVQLSLNGLKLGAKAAMALRLVTCCFLLLLPSSILLDLKTIKQYLLHDLMQSVVAYMLYTLNCLTAHIAKLAVCPKHRRQGWAAALLALVLQELQTKRRIRTFTLHVADVNVPAKALYAKAGFVEDGFLEVSATVCCHCCPCPDAHNKLDHPRLP